MLLAVDYNTGKIKWSHKWEGPGGPRNGVLSTAGSVVIAGAGDTLFNYAMNPK